MDDTPPDKLEKVERAFREIEAESERRAAKEAEEARSQPGPLPVGLIALHAATLNGVPQAKKRRRGSISISRLGNYGTVSAPPRTDGNDTGSSNINQPTSPLATHFDTSTSTTPQPLYQHEVGSASSITSDEDETVSEAHERPENHTTQKETIIGRRNTISKAVGGVLKTIPRMRSSKALADMQRADSSSVVIGVSVSEATVSHVSRPSQEELERLKLGGGQQTSTQLTRITTPSLESKGRLLRSKSSSNSISDQKADRNIRKPRTFSLMAKAVGKKLRPKRSQNSMGDSDG